MFSYEHLIAYIMKQIIFSYNKYNTFIYARFYDIRKAFERIDNDKLILVLKNVYVPNFIAYIDILIYLFCNKRFYLKQKNYLFNL